MSMPPVANLFIDTSGWADPLLRNTPDHQRMAALYTAVLASERPLVTTNYVLSELVALLTTRARAPRADILAYMKDIRTDPHVWCLDYPDTRGVDRFFSSTGPPPVGTLKKGSLD